MDRRSFSNFSGCLLGALLGREAIPTGWVDGIELRAEIDRMAEELV
jgi:hypothetical protein